VAPVHLTSIHCIRFEGNVGALSQAAIEAKDPQFKTAFQLIWSALPEKAIDNTVEDYHKQLQTCLSQTVDILNL